MSRGQMFRALMTERLTAAAEEISVLSERTIAEYEEELRRSKEENERKQWLLDAIRTPRVQLLRVDTGPGLNQDFTETPRIKEEPEEQSVTPEEEQLSGSDSETEADTELFSDTNHDDDWEPPFSCSPPQLETEADGDHYNQARDRRTKLSQQNRAETSSTVNNGDGPGNDQGAERKHQCHYCQKRFKTKQTLQRHIREHTGDKPYSCSTCKRAFTRKCNLDTHRRIHTDEKPYSCSTCKRAFTRKCNLDTHRRIHTDEKPYSCSTCKRAFTRKCNLDTHRRIHTDEKPYSCSTCKRDFTQKGHRGTHRRIHTGGKPFPCSICHKSFSDKSHFNSHMRTHRRAR